MDIPKLSPTERLILELLSGEEMFGLQLVEQSKGALKRGTVYVTLGRMQDKGYVESWTEKQPPAPSVCRGVCIVRRPTACACSRRGKLPRARWRVHRNCGTPDDARPHAPSPGRSHLQRETLERVVEPAIADLQKEYAQPRTSTAVTFSRTGSGYVAILKVIAMCALNVSLPRTTTGARSSE